MLDIGKYKGKPVTTNDDNLKNRHIAVIGESGSGKTVECQRLICSAVKQGHTIIAFDMHGTLAGDQIFWKYKETFETYMYEIHARESGIPCNLFSPIKYRDGTFENPIDTIGALTDVVADTINAGCIQSAELRKAFQYTYELGNYDEMGFKAIDDALKFAGNKVAEVLREKLYFLTSHNVFVPGEKMFEEGKINIFRLSRFNLKAQETVAEMILSYLWRLANAEQFKDKQIYIFVDECQNLPSGKNNALAQILSEGRKMGVNLILATQMVLQGNASAVQQRIMQCGLMLYFKPAANRVATTAKMIDARAEAEWSRLLRTLSIGEFVADGSFIVDGKVKNEALKISAVETKGDVDEDREQISLYQSRMRGRSKNISV